MKQSLIVPVAHLAESPFHDEGTRSFAPWCERGKVLRVKTLEISLSDEIVAKVEQAAHDRGVSVQDIVQSSVVEKLEREGEFEVAAAHVLAKNAELYGRLA